MKSFFDQHLSLVFLFLLILASLVLAWFGMLFNDTSWNILGIFCSQLSGASLAAAVTTLFLSFPDVRKYMARLLATLMSEGQVTSLLRPSVALELRRRILLDRLPEVQSLEPSLLSYLEGISEQCLASVFVYNYNTETVVEEDPDFPSLHKWTTVIQFRVKARHLEAKPTCFPYEYACHFPTSGLLKDFELTDIVPKFELTSGGDKYTNTDLTTNIVQEDSGEYVEFYFRREFEIEDERDFTVRYTVRAPKNDHNDVTYARYPTYGFRATLRFKNDLEYDYFWFTHWNKEESAFPGHATELTGPDNIIVNTNDWVLPGEGVFLFWR